MKKKQGFFIGFAVLLIAAIFTLAGCDTEEAIWLADLNNPFFGSWKSAPDDIGSTLAIVCKADGTFDYVMDNLPPEYAAYGTGTGGYLIKDNVMISYFPTMDMLKSNTFEVINNDAIKVTEVEIEAGGVTVPGETSIFTRVPGTPVNKENNPFVLNHPYLGKWELDGEVVFAPETPAIHVYVMYDMRADGILGYDFEIPGYPPGSEISSYFICGNMFVVYSEEDGIESSEITPDNSEEPTTITVAADFGGTLTLTRVSD